MQKETPNTSGDPHLEAVLAVNIACLACDLACDLPQIPLEQCDALLMEFRRQVRPTAWASACGSPMRERWRP